MQVLAATNGPLPAGQFDTSSISSAKATTTYNFYTAYYGGDTWQVNKKLTASYGIRVDVPGSYAEAANNAYVLLPTAEDPLTGLTGTLALVNTSLYSSKYVLNTVAPQWGPRVGFAYRLTENTVFRGGYALSYLSRDTQTGVFGAQMTINSAVTNNTNNKGAVPGYTMGVNPFAPANNPAGPESMTVASGRANTSFMLSNLTGGVAIKGPLPSEPFPYSQQINVSVGHQFKGDTLVDIGLAHAMGIAPGGH